MMTSHTHAGRVILAHGRAAAMEIPTRFEAEWVAATRYGLERVGYEHAACVEITMPFYGKIWRPDEDIVPPDFDPGLGESVAAERGFPDFGRVVEGFFEWLDRRTGGSGKVPEWILNDTKEYLDRSDLRRRVDRLLGEACAGSAEPVLVGFSMGSIVGYHLLALGGTAFPVQSFITCGSPMGNRAFRDRIARVLPDGRLIFPPSLRMWANIWNDDDPATQVYELTPYYGGERFIQAQPTRGRGPGVTNPAAAHNAIDYLSSKALGAALRVALEAAG